MALEQRPLARPLAAGEPTARLSLRPLWVFVRRKPLGAAGLFLIIILVLTALLAPIVATHDPEAAVVRQRLQPPSSLHFLGTDGFGRDVFSRIVYGSQGSLYVGLVAVLLGTALGSLLGLLSGYFGGGFDFLVQRLMDILLAFPMIVLALAILSALGSSLFNVIVALGIVLTPSANRVVRGSVLSARENQYVEAARAIGCGHIRIVFTHILPNVAAPIIVLASITLGLAILVEASLSFLGLGPPPPTPTWGGMLSVEGRRFFERAWWLAVFPGLAISLAVLSFNLFGDALRDIWDPRLRGTR